MLDLVTIFYEAPHSDASLSRHSEVEGHREEVEYLTSVLGDLVLPEAPTQVPRQVLERALVDALTPPMMTGRCRRYTSSSRLTSVMMETPAWLSKMAWSGSNGVGPLPVLSGATRQYCGST